MPAVVQSVKNPTDIICRNLFPGHYVVVIGHSEKRQFRKVVDRIAEVTGNLPSTIAQTYLDEILYVDCGFDKEYAISIFDLMNKQDSPYTVLFGPIDMNALSETGKQIIVKRYKPEEISQGISLRENR